MSTQAYKRQLSRHVEQVKQRYQPACPICQSELIMLEGEYTLAGTDPRRPVTTRTLGCGTCGFIMMFELPETIRAHNPDPQA